MNKNKLSLMAIVALATLTFVACGDNDRDTEPPTITTDGVEASPMDCDAYRRGDTIEFRYRLTDNVALGKFNLEVHDNHDHHTHSTQPEECEHEPEHEEVNPWVFNRDYDIPADTRDYVATASIPVPTDVDPGDYHFMIRVTDQAGWQQLRSVAIKVK